jgi:hypothetical protein
MMERSIIFTEEKKEGGGSGGVYKSSSSEFGARALISIPGCRTNPGVRNTFDASIIMTD